MKLFVTVSLLLASLGFSLACQTPSDEQMQVEHQEKLNRLVEQKRQMELDHFWAMKDLQDERNDRIAEFQREVRLLKDQQEREQEELLRKNRRELNSLKLKLSIKQWNLDRALNSPLVQQQPQYLSYHQPQHDRGLTLEQQQLDSIRIQAANQLKIAKLEAALRDLDAKLGDHQ